MMLTSSEAPSTPCHSQGLACAHRAPSPSGGATRWLRWAQRMGWEQAGGSPGRAFRGTLLSPGG